MGSKLVLILKTLLWVLTDSQLKAALHFLDSLSGLIKKANEIVRKKKAARKLEVSNVSQHIYFKRNKNHFTYNVIDVFFYLLFAYFILGTAGISSPEVPS